VARDRPQRRHRSMPRGVPRSRRPARSGPSGYSGCTARRRWRVSRRRPPDAGPSSANPAASARRGTVTTVPPRCSVTTRTSRRSGPGR
jgi:hypothetical protein